MLIALGRGVYLAQNDARFRQVRSVLVEHDTFKAHQQATALDVTI